MRPRSFCRPSLLGALFVSLTLPWAAAQDFSQLWLLGDDANGNQTEFSQETGPQGPPGSPTAQDDDFYFAGTYDDPIGLVANDEAFVNYDRALTPGDTVNRIHFNLNAVEADPDTQLRLTVAFCCIGSDAAVAPNPSHDVAIRVNGNEVFSQDDITADLLVEETGTAADWGAVEGANTVEIERMGGTESSWIQFDYVRLEYAATDADGDGIPDEYENLYAFLDPNNPADAELDEDSDGLSNLGEFLAGSDPTNPDTDGDGLNDGPEVTEHGSSPLRADTDGDGLTDEEEVNTHMTDPTLADTDGDTLSDADEVLTHMTDPNLADSDSDGFDDALEIELGTDPNDSEDTPVLFTQLWQLAEDDNSQADFTQEVGGSEPAPGSATALDDDYYFAGTYPDPIGVVEEDEPLVNFERALTSGNPVTRLHFNLDDIEAESGSEYRVTVDLIGLGPAEGSSHNIAVRLNGTEFMSQSAITAPVMLEGTVTADEADAVVGENVLEIEDTDASGWIQFDFIRFEFRGLDNDRDGLPNAYETKYAFLDPNNPADAEMDEDEDGLTNLGEFQNGTDPDNPDSDQDGLLDGAEIENGTLPLVADTDGDSLLDGSEVNTHMTNPLLPDTDHDGLDDAEEVALGTSPLDPDSDGDGDTDHEEVLYGTNPLDADSTPLAYMDLWQVGNDDDSQAEFTQEAGGSPPAPGSAMALDDDYYFAGDYPPPIGSVPADEDWAFFERALTSGNFFSRLHFNLDEEQASPSTQIKLTVDLILLGSDGGPSIHDLVFRVNGTEIMRRDDIDTPLILERSFLTSEVNAVAGENVVEIERTGQSAPSWIQFDYVRAEFREVLTDDPNLNVPRRNIFGELPGLGVRTADLEITNNGETEALVISNAVVTGPDAAHYTLSNVPDTIPSGGMATMQVTFDPQGRAGGFTAFLEFSSNDVSDPVIRVDLSALIPNANGLIAHYKLDETEGSVALDASGRGRHGEYTSTDSGTFVLGEPALAGAGTAVTFDHGATGAGFVEIPDSFNPLIDTSVSMWFQTQAGADSVLTMISKNRSGEQGDPFAVAYQDGNLFAFTGGATDVTVSGVSGGEPHHLAVVFDNASEEKQTLLYLDGELVAQEPGNGFDDAQGASAIVIGALGGSFGFQGTIDDVQIYEKVLTQENVTYLIENPGAVLPGEDVVDPTVDTDGDGQSDEAEELAGTDPNDPTSVFAVTSAERVENGVSLTWSSVDGKNYVVEYSPTMEADSWTDIDTVAGNADMTSYVDADAGRTTGEAGFYRLRVDP